MVVDGDMETLKPKNMNLVPTSHWQHGESWTDLFAKYNCHYYLLAEYWPIVSTAVVVVVVGDFIYNQRDGRFDMRSLNSQATSKFKE